MNSSSLRLRQLRRALLRLREALALPPSPIIRDGCIQRFEFTFEAAWKAIQTDALAEGGECASPRDCFRAAFRLGVLSTQEQRWFQMVEDRNRTSHTYDEEIAEAIYRSLPAYAAMFATLSRSLGKREKQRAAEKPRLFEK